MRLILFSLILYLTSIHLIGQDANNDEIPLSKLKVKSHEAYESGDWQSYLETTISIAETFGDEDLLDSSIWYLEKALEQEYNAQGLDSLWALCYHTLGIQYFWITDDLSAIDSWSKALEIRKQFLPSNHIDIIKGYRNIAGSHYELENIEKAIEYGNLAYELNSSHKNPDVIKSLQISLDLSAAYMKSGDLDKAYRFLTLAEKPMFKTYDENHWELDHYYYQWWSYFNLKDDTEKMKLYAQKSIDLLNSVDDKYDEDHLSLAAAYSNLGLAYKKEENFNLSIESFISAIETYKRFNENEGVERKLADSYSNLSQTYYELKDYEKALEYIEYAIALNAKLLNQKSMIKDLENKADMVRANGDLSNALIIIDKAIALTRLKKSDDKYLISRPIRVLLNRTKCKILNELYELNGDISYAKEASLLIEDNIKIIDEIRSSYQSEESKAFLALESKMILEEGIQFFLKQYNYTNDQNNLLNAWELSEKAKSIILLESLRASQAKKQTGVEDALLIKEDSLKKVLSNIESEIYNRPEDAAALNKSYLESSKELEIITERISIENPTYSRATKAISTLSLNNYLNRTDYDIVEYFIGEENAYVFTKSVEGINYFIYERPSEITDLVSQIRKSTVDVFKNSFKKDEAYTATVRNYNQAAFKLYNILFGIIGDDITLKEDLLIVPDGVLGYLPFDLLLTQVSEGDDFGSKPYLIRKHNISYTYSLALFSEMQDYKTNSDQAMLAMAPSFVTNDEVYKYGNKIVRKERQPELYFNEEEIGSIQTIMNNTNVIGADATEEYFMENASDYNIIHLSTHGKANDEKGSFSYLAFTEIVDTTENEFVYNYDLYNLKLNADMVVLSACETGIGELKEGEGIISLARGFSYAGAKSIVSTLWTINDYRTKEIMESFYTHISEGKNKDISLREAKLSFIQNNPKEALPFYWAAFIPIGDMSSINTTNGNMNVIPIIAIGFILVMFFLFRSRF